MKLPQSGYWSAFPRAVILIILLACPQLSVLASAQQLTSTPSDLHFGKVSTGQTKILGITLTNTGSSSVTVSSVTNAPAFTVSSSSLPLTLAAGQDAQVEITFAPTSVGHTVTTLAFASNASNNPLDVQVQGTGVTEWSLTANPPSLAFGNVQTGSSSTLPVVLTNSGTSGITISQGQVVGAAFSLSGLDLPLDLAPGASFTFSATFTPQSSGPASGALRVTNPTNPVLRIPLTGVGTAYSVSLSWDPSSSPVEGYNVYRGGKTGGPYAKIFALDPNTSYTDNTVTDGNTYYYVTTAVNSSGEESTYSNQVQAVIP